MWTLLGAAMHNSLTEIATIHGHPLSFFSLFFPICLLKKGPQDLPWSMSLLLRACLVQLISSAVLFLLITPFAGAWYRAVIGLALSLVVWSLVLLISNRRERLMQVLTAVQGVAALLNIAMWPLFFGLSMLPQGGMLLGLLNLAIIAWSIVIHAHIIGHALEWKKAFSITLAIALFLIRVSLFQLIVGSV